MALSRVVSEIFNVEKSRDLEIGVIGHSMSLKVVPSVDRVRFPIVFFSVLRYSTSKYTVTLKPALGVTQGHRKSYHSIRLFRHL